MKTAANFGHYLRGVDNISAAIRTTTSAMKDFLYSRGMKGHNVIFSVENLCTLDPAQVKAFHAMLTKGSGLEQLVSDTNGISANTQIFHGFDVTIVVTYREFLRCDSQLRVNCLGFELSTFASRLLFNPLSIMLHFASLLSNCHTPTVTSVHTMLA